MAGSLGSLDKIHLKVNGSPECVTDDVWILFLF